MYIVLDVEATDEQEIIEIGAVKLNEQLEVVDKFQSFVRPTKNHVLTYYIKKLTGIQQQEVDQAEPFPNVFQSFTEWAGNQPFLITWSKSDKLYFRGEFLQHKLENTFLHHFIDIQSIVCKLISSESVMNLKKVLECFELEFDGTEHRALNDAVNTAKLFVVAMNHAKGIRNIQELEVVHELSMKVSTQVVQTIPETPISHQRYQAYLGSLSLSELETKKKVLYPLVKEAENTIRPDYLVQVAWQKFKAVNELLALKKKEHALESEGLSLAQMDVLLKCSHSIHSMRNNLVTNVDEEAVNQAEVFKKKIEANFKHVTKLYKLENLKVTKIAVVQCFEWLAYLIHNLTASPYFRKKYHKQLDKLLAKITTELEAIVIPDAS